MSVLLAGHDVEGVAFFKLAGNEAGEVDVDSATFHCLVTPIRIGLILVAVFQGILELP